MDPGGVTTAAVPAELVRVVVLVAAGLLLPAGVSKWRHPDLTRDALRLAGGRATAAVRVLGVGETVLGVLVLVSTSRLWLGTLALLYAGFAVVAARQRRAGAGCGCLGAATTPTSRSHVAFDVGAAVAAGITAAGAVGAPDLPRTLADDPLVGIATVLAVSSAVWGAQLALTGVPELRDARRRVALPAPTAHPGATS